MKSIILSLMLFLPIIGYAQNKNNVSLSNAQRDSLLLFMCHELDQLDINTSLKERYKLYQTDNVYNLLLLDSKTGKIDQIQWSLDSDNEGTWSINDTDLTTIYSHGSNTFELYPTKNMYQFILLDKTDGRKWHVQWGTEDSKRWIRRIY